MKGRAYKFAGGVAYTVFLVVLAYVTALFLAFMVHVLKILLYEIM